MIKGLAVEAFVVSCACAGPPPGIFGLCSSLTVTFAICSSWTWAHNDLNNICLVYLFFFPLFKLATIFRTTFLSVSGNNPPRDSSEDSALICISSLLKLELLSAGVAWAFQAWGKRQRCHPEILEHQMCLSGNANKILILSPRKLWQGISVSGQGIWQQSNVSFHLEYF